MAEKFSKWRPLSAAIGTCGIWLGGGLMYALKASGLWELLAILIACFLTTVAFTGMVMGME